MEKLLHNTENLKEEKGKTCLNIVELREEYDEYSEEDNDSDFLKDFFEEE